MAIFNFKTQLSNLVAQEHTIYVLTNVQSYRFGIDMICTWIYIIHKYIIRLRTMKLILFSLIGL